MERRSLLGTALVGTAAAAGLAGPARADAPGWSPEHPMRVQIVLFDGVEEQDFAGPYEVFSLAGRQSSGAVRVGYVTGGGPGTVTAAFGTKVTVADGWAPSEADVIVVPGGGFARRSGPGIWAEIAGEVLPRRLAAAAKQGVLVTSLCTGAILLAEAGLTAGRPCTTHAGAKSELASRGGNVINARVVDDGDLVTSAGVTSGLELALHLVRREIGSAVAVRVESILEYEARGTVWTSRG